MKVAIFSTKSYDETYLPEKNKVFGHDLTFFEVQLNPKTAPLAEGFPCVCPFPNDDLGASTLKKLKAYGVNHIAMRCAGYNNLDVETAHALGFTITRVPSYSPYAVAEHTVALMMTLNRKIHKAYNRVREGNFSLEGLEGFEMHGKTVGIVGTGQIGYRLAQILTGFGCKLLGYDIAPNPACEALGVSYVTLEHLWSESDIISLHCPLTPKTFHLVNEGAIAQMKPGVMLINTSRGATIDTQAVIDGLKSGRIGYLGLDVYEEEGDLFFEDNSNKVIQDDVLSRLLVFPNVIITGHQAFLTRLALENIAQTTLQNIADVEAGRPCPNRLLPPVLV